MSDLYNIYEKLGISPIIYNYTNNILEELKSRFDKIDETAELCQLKVLSAMQKEKVSTECFNSTTGYGYGDIGRDTLERVYADVFRGEDALVRSQITCGTHALCLALFSNLRPKDELIYISGKPYDTLEEVIGIRQSKGSFAEYDISYSQVNLKDNSFDYEGIKHAINDRTKLIAIQRSRGYDIRPSFGVDELKKVISYIKNIRSDIIIMVDNCYGEFVENREPLEAGADMIVGSLIKNPGGGIAPMGGYIVGNKSCIENAANRLTSPGLGREVGASLNTNLSMYQGLFIAPTVTASALKGAVFAANIYERLGFNVYPKANDTRHDIIQAIELKSDKALIEFCTGIQEASPVDSFVSPRPWDMPGYDSKVIMASGSFISGSSIELSADGPLKKPYNVYFQGGLTWPHVRYAIVNSLQKLYDAKLVIDSKLC